MKQKTLWWKWWKRPVHPYKASHTPISNHNWNTVVLNKNRHKTHVELGSEQASHQVVFCFSSGISRGDYCLLSDTICSLILDLGTASRQRLALHNFIYWIILGPFRSVHKQAFTNDIQEKLIWGRLIKIYIILEFFRKVGIELCRLILWSK